MSIQPGDGITPTEPGGALRLDANLNGGAVTAAADGVLVRGQYGAECVIAGQLVSSAYLASIGAGNFAGIPFGDTIVDYSEFSGLPQCDSTDGVLIAQVEGIYEIGAQLMVQQSSVAAACHYQIGIWTDYGFSNLALSPTVAFGTANGAFGASWQRIGLSTLGFATGTTSTNPSIPDAGGFPIAVVTQWCVKAPPSGLGVGATFPQTSAPPTRFRIGVRSDVSINVIDNATAQALAWMRWIGAPA